MKKTTVGMIFAAGLTLGGAGATIAAAPKVYAHSIQAARLPVDGKHKFATGTIYGGDFSGKEFADLGARRIDFTPEEQACLNAIMDRGGGLFSK